MANSDSAASGYTVAAMLRPELYAAFMQRCQDLGWTRSKLLRKAVMDYMAGPMGGPDLSTIGTEALLASLKRLEARLATIERKVSQ